MKACNDVNLAREDSLLLLGDMILCNKEVEESRNLVIINLYFGDNSNKFNKISKKEIIMKKIPK